jgi:outer membrane protein W
MRRIRKLTFVLFCLALTIGFFATAAHAQQPGRAYVLGAIGFGLLADDEGSLGAGPAPGGGGGWQITDRFAVEAAAVTRRHEQSGSLSWFGNPFTLTAQGVFRFGAPDSRVRPFVAAGVGYFRYTGTLVEDVFSSPGVPPTRVSTDWRVSSVVVEGGAGVEVPIGRILFIRPEAWLAIASATRARPAPEPPYAMPRVALSIGARF